MTPDWLLVVRHVAEVYALIAALVAASLILKAPIGLIDGRRVVLNALLWPGLLWRSP